MRETEGIERTIVIIDSEVEQSLELISPSSSPSMVPDQHHQPYLRIFKKQMMGLHPRPMNQKLWGWIPLSKM